MKPTLLPGDFVLALKVFNKVFFKNDIVIFFDDHYSHVVKKVVLIKKNHLMLKNDNINTSSVFCEKPFDKNKVKYRVLFILRVSKIKKIFVKLKFI